jgi:hypothetical protein
LGLVPPKNPDSQQKAGASSNDADERGGNAGFPATGSRKGHQEHRSAGSDGAEGAGGDDLEYGDVFTGNERPPRRARHICQFLGGNIRGAEPLSNLVEARHHVDIGPIEAHKQQLTGRDIEGCARMEDACHFTDSRPPEDCVGCVSRSIHPFGSFFHRGSSRDVSLRLGEGQPRNLTSGSFLSSSFEAPGS